MSAMVKLGNASRTGSYLGIPSTGKDEVMVTQDLMGIRLRAGRVEAVGGKSDGTTIEDKIVDANQQVLIYPPVALNPRQYHILLTCNPALLRYGMVSCPSLIDPKESDNVVIAFKAARKTDLNEFDHIFELNMLD